MNLNDYMLMGQESLFGEHSNGFRLQKLEVYNWGTFDGKVWAFRPNGTTSLLTGDSGSGKSTLVDALVTLLVSPRKTAYNKAADASARERTITSYVLGYHGQKHAYEGKGTPEALRDYKQYTTLLATLEDTTLNRTVTIAAFFWFREQKGNPSRFYVVGHREFSIVEDFTNFHGDVKQLKAILRTKGCEVFDDYNHYSACYRKALGELSPQGIDLFQQTISMKKVEALTDFVRSSMLEETEIAADIEKLLQHYHSLNSAYEAVVRAREQAQLLEPICLNGTQYSRQKDEQDQIISGQAALDRWFATLKAPLYVKKIAALEEELLSVEAAVAAEEELLDQRRNEVKQIEKEIDRNGGGALENLRSELGKYNEIMERRKKNRAQYSAYAEQVGLPVPTTSEMFRENEQRAAKLWDELSSKGEAVGERVTAASVKIQRLQEEKADIDAEIESLRGRTSNIPKELIALRAQICSALEVPETGLPFAGELMEVCETQLAWEGAIERLTHSFALSLLVSERHYGLVSKWVNERHLGARIVYFSTKQRSGEIARLPLESVAGKLSVKQDTSFTSWLTRELAERFQHVCCRDLATFRSEKRAITLMGQIKSSTRHEKDDRRNLNDRTRYVLGFSNQKKIQALVQEALQLEDRVQHAEDEKNSAIKAQKILGDQNAALKSLGHFSEFSEIDVQGMQHEVDVCKQRMKELSQENGNMLEILNGQLEIAKEREQNQLNRLVVAKTSANGIMDSVKTIEKQHAMNQGVLESENPFERMAYPFLEKNMARFLDDEVFTLENSMEQQNSYLAQLSKERSKVEGRVSELKSKVEQGIFKFRHQFPQETRETDDTIQSLPEFYHMQNQLLEDDLPRYESDFKARLTSQVLQQIALFQVTLKQQHDQVRTRIEAINNSLHEIDYNPSRYIKLNCENNPDSEVRSFRAQLKACTEGAASGLDDESLLTVRFQKIKDIIGRFQGREKESETDKRWTKKVTDVRNWFVFSASERWRENDEEYEHFTDSGGKSGGQKEKLAYTILAASLVYNYGLQDSYLDQPSFRLVVIDEAFLKSSDDSAKYGLKLFEQLRFQLVIVTPLLKISTIEPFISHVGFVSHDDVVHKSSLINIPIEVYKEKRKAWEDLQHA